MSVSREGYPFILIAVFLTLIALILGWAWVGLVFGILTFVFVGFFRDPVRTPPTGEGLILSPADGKVVGIKELEGKGFFEGAATRISIFLSPLDVHVNRAPVRGQVEDAYYQEGKFFAAYREQASQNNEQNALRIIDPEGRKLSVVQIAGAMARRIVCYVKKGDDLERGEKFGLIMFGSRTDLLLPRGSRVEVVEGQQVRGGETIMGRFP
ncbi:MAG: phosphatidylserine decarboxylase family protein [Candidatus Binatia bacterium]